MVDEEPKYWNCWNCDEYNLTYWGVDYCSRCKKPKIKPNLSDSLMVDGELTPDEQSGLGEKILQFSHGKDIKWGHSGTCDDESWRRVERRCLYIVDEIIKFYLAKATPIIERRVARKIFKDLHDAIDELGDDWDTNEYARAYIQKWKYDILKSHYLPEEEA